MSSKVLVVLEDDVNGGEASETITFAIDGTQYEIDLNDQNAKKLRDALDGYVSKARKTGGRRSGARKASSEIDNRAVRAWAQANGIEVSERGRISASVVEQFRAAGN